MKYQDVHAKLWDQQMDPEVPKGWIQWKGTHVCMDIYCSCGERSHVDSGFTYFVRCPKCEAVYFVNGHVELVPATKEEVEVLEKEEVKIVRAQ